MRTKITNFPVSDKKNECFNACYWRKSCETENEIRKNLMFFLTQLLRYGPVDVGLFLVP